MFFLFFYFIHVTAVDWYIKKAINISQTIYWIIAIHVIAVDWYIKKAINISQTIYRIIATITACSPEDRVADNTTDGFFLLSSWVLCTGNNVILTPV